MVTADTSEHGFVRANTSEILDQPQECSRGGTVKKRGHAR
jgi:hypothetical protein